MTTKATKSKSAADFVNDAFKTITDAPVAAAKNLHIIGGQLPEKELIPFL